MVDRTELELDRFNVNSINDYGDVHGIRNYSKIKYHSDNWGQVILGMPYVSN